MKKEKQTIEELQTAFEKYLISLKRSRFTIRQYQRIWKSFNDYTTTQGIHFYDRSVGDADLAFSKCCQEICDR